MRVLMDINQMLLDASEDHTPEELAELTKQHSQMTVLAGQAVSFVLLTVAGCTITMEMLELYFDAGAPPTDKGKGGGKEEKRPRLPTSRPSSGPSRHQLARLRRRARLAEGGTSQAFFCRMAKIGFWAVWAILVCLQKWPFWGPVLVAEFAKVCSAKSRDFVLGGPAGAVGRF